MSRNWAYNGGSVISESLYALLVDVELHWGLSINHFLGTKSRPALRVIPPTTLIGALSYPLAKIKKWPENIGSLSSADRLRSVLTSVHYSVLLGHSVTYAEVSKVFSYKVRERKVISDAVAVQKIYTKPGTILRIYYIFHDHLARDLGPSWKKELRAAGWGIVRIGAKESLVSVKDSRFVDVNLVKVKGFVKTKATVPLDSVKSIKGSFTIEEVIDWRVSGVGRYFEAPRTRIAQPVSALGGPGKVEVLPTSSYVYEIGKEIVIPWTISSGGG
mgnify:CR=1 FL=1